MLPKINKIVLVAPLDWGLGHTTRCIPLIKLLHQKGFEIILAVSGMQEVLLRKEFANLEYLHLDGYQIGYAKKKLMWHLFKQINRIYKSIEHEHQWLLKLARQRKIDWIISDNRYGLWHPQIPCTFITHQLKVQLPKGLGFAEKMVQWFIYGQINRFTYCWVPDDARATFQLSGKLGHPAHLPKIQVCYIGWLSRFYFQPPKSSYRYRCIVLLSGPEPQRTMLENIICQSLKAITFDMILVRGLPGNTAPQLKISERVKVYNHLPTIELQSIIAESEFLVARSGYSTLMDAFTLQKKCIFIPTLGQTEQEYLAKELHKKNAALVYEQNKFNLLKALKDADDFDFIIPKSSQQNLLEKTMENMGW